MIIFEQQSKIFLSEKTEVQENIPLGTLTRNEVFAAKKSWFGGKNLLWSRLI
jgi:hypothetical protein